MCESKVSCVSREGSKYVSCYYTLTWGVVLLVQSVEGGCVEGVRLTQLTALRPLIYLDKEL